MKSGRISWIDFAKGIAILLVVFGHISFLPSPILGVIYSFHMPLFFFLSGVLLFRHPESFGSFVLKKGRTLIRPYYVFLALQVIIFYAAYRLGFKHAISYILGGWSSLVGLSSLWFLYTLFFIQLMLFPLYNSYANSKKIVGGGSILLIIIVCLLKVDCFTMNVPFEQFRGSTMPFGLDLLFLGGSFVLLGMAAREYLLAKQIPLWLAGVCLVVAVVCGVVNYRISGNHQVELFEQFTGNPIFFYLSALSGIIVVVAMSQRAAEQDMDGDSVRQHSVVRWMEWCGRSSLAIYAIHWIFTPFICAPVFNYLLPLHPSFIYKAGCSLLAFLGIILLTVPAVWLVEKKMPWVLGRTVSHKGTKLQ